MDVFVSHYDSKYPSLPKSQELLLLQTSTRWATSNELSTKRFVWLDAVMVSSQGGVLENGGDGALEKGGEVSRPPFSAFLSGVVGSIL